MDHATFARQIRDAIYARSDLEGGAISREQMDQAIEGALARFAPANSWIERPAPGIKACGNTIEWVASIPEVADAVTWTWDVG